MWMEMRAAGRVPCQRVDCRREIDGPLHAALHNGPINSTTDHGISNPLEPFPPPQIYSHPDIQQLGQRRDNWHRSDFSE